VKRCYGLNSSSPFKLIWDLIINSIFTVSFMMIPLVLCSKMALLDDFRITEIVFDVLMFFDIIFTFFVAETHNQRLKDCVLNYLFGYFIFDFIATVPGLVTLELVKEIYFLKVLRFLQLGRFFRQVHFILNYVARLFAFISLTTVKNAIKMAKLLMTLFLMIHIFACVFIFIGDNSGNKGWVNSDEGFDSHDNKFYNAYPTALYFVVTTFTTVGYGDYSASSNLEMFFVMISELAGLAVFSSVMGSLQSFDKEKSANFLIQEKQEEITEFLTELDNAREGVQLPKEIYESFRKSLEMNYNYGIKNIVGLHGFYEVLKP